MQLERLTTRLEHDSLLRTVIVHTQVLPGRAAVYQKPKERLAEPIEKALKAFDVSQLYAHGNKKETNEKIKKIKKNKKKKYKKKKNKKKSQKEKNKKKRELKRQKGRKKM